MTPSAAGAIHRLAWTTTEAEAMALVAQAVLRGASPDEAHEALGLWRQLRREDVQTLEMTP